MDDDEEEFEDELDSYDSEAEEGINEMMGEGMLDSSDDYGSEDDEHGEDEYS